MESIEKIKPEASIIVILGATGDLTWRKLIPAIYNLYLDNWTPEKFAVIGVSRTKISEVDFHKRLHQGVDKFSRRGKAKKAEWTKFAQQLVYLPGDFNKSATYTAVEKKIKSFEKEWKVTANRIFYLAVPPNAFESVSNNK